MLRIQHRLDQKKNGQNFADLPLYIKGVFEHRKKCFTTGLEWRSIGPAKHLSRQGHPIFKRYQIIQASTDL